MRFPIYGGSIALIITGVEALNLPRFSPWDPLQLLHAPICIDPTKQDSLDSAWEGLESCSKHACISANREIGGGMVLVTSERNAKIVSEFPDPPEPPPGPPPFIQAMVPGKGVGLIANRTIHKGELIMVRPVTMMVQTSAHTKLDLGNRDMLYERAVARLPGPKRGLFMSQMGKGIFDKIETNCFQVFIDKESKEDEETGSHLGCFPEISRFNHDCRPNLHYRIENVTHTTVAVRDIAAGEELSITYIGQMHPREERQTRLRRWGFNCTCAQCSLSRRDTEVSDARLRAIEQLEADLGVFNRTLVTAETGADLVRLHERERLDIYLGRALTRAALNFALFGQTERAREYARRAVEAMEMYIGPQSEDAKSMRVLAENPKEHWTWGKRRGGRGRVVKESKGKGGE